MSHHFANISHLILGGTHGETHVGARTREVFERYRGREAELQATAKEIRLRFMAIDLTPRVEKEVPRERARQLTLDVFGEAKRLGIPEEAVDTYEREGSWFFGVMLKLSKALTQNPTVTIQFLAWLAHALGDSLSRSKGFDLALQGRWQDLADESVSRLAPQLHLHELDPQDRITLALGTPSLRKLRLWKPKPKHLAALGKMNREAERDRIGKYLGIDASNLCDYCLLMLKDLVDKELA